MRRQLESRRILLVDDNPSIHNDYQKVLCGVVSPNSEFTLNDELIFGKQESKLETKEMFHADSAYQGTEAVQLAKSALLDGRPYSVALVDIRMPPGWDGVTTAKELWSVDPNLLVVFCTAYSDYSWKEMTESLGHNDKFVILKKPFDNLELYQLVNALTRQWTIERQVEQEQEDSLSQSTGNGEAESFARDSIAQYLQRLQLACSDIIYRQYRHEIHSAPDESNTNSTLNYLEVAKSKIGQAANQAYCKLQSESSLAGFECQESQYRMLQVVDNLLTLSQLDDNRFEAEANTFKSEDLLDSIGSRFYQLADSGDTKSFEITKEGQLAEWIRTDFERIKLLLCNVLENAFLSPQDGHIELQIGFEEHRDGDWIRFRVRVSGPRGNADARHRQFPFADGDMREQELHLGWLVCNRLVDELKGEFKIEANNESESTLCFLMPVEILTAAPESEDYHQHSKYGLTALVSQHNTFDLNQGTGHA